MNKIKNFFTKNKILKSGVSCVSVKKIAVCVFTGVKISDFESPCGGEFRYLLTVAKGLKELGHDVTVLLDNEYSDFQDNSVDFIHYNNIVDIKEFDVIFTQDTDFFRRTLLPLKQSNPNLSIVMYSVGNINTDYDLALCSAYIFKDPPCSWRVWSIDKSLLSFILYAYIDMPPRLSFDKYKMITASTELYSDIGFDVGYEIFLKVKECVPELKYDYYYVKDWVNREFHINKSDSVVSYFEENNILEKIETGITGSETKIDGFNMIDFISHDKYIKSLVKAGFYLHNRGGTKALTGNEAMALGVCTVNPKWPHFTVSDLAINYGFDFGRKEERSVGIELCVNKIIDLINDDKEYKSISKLQTMQTRPNRTKQNYLDKLNIILNAIYS
tara:strand:+ start:11404 stop:12561 length:1158 start_codon:yes stop_codon:yes gene_type:complete